MIYPKQASQIREVDGSIQMWFGKWETTQSLNSRKMSG